MIVVDTNVIAYLYLPSAPTVQAEQLLINQPDWVAPLLWRSEMRNVLALYVRKGMLDLDAALAIQTEAESLLSDSEYEIPSADVLELAEASHCSAYDCEFVALARRLGVKLVTADKKLISKFPAIALSISDAV